MAAQWKDLFPTITSFIVFIMYMFLFICQGLLVKGSQAKNNNYSYNTILVVLLTENLKLLMSVAIFIKDKGCRELFHELKDNIKLGAFYIIPSALYCIYNNLSFVNLSHYDPTTYFLLLQFRVVCTAILFQLLFKQILSRIQWTSLLLLTLGCVIKEMGPKTERQGVVSADTETSLFNIHLVLLLLQMFCSCFAGVYNELLMKDRGANVHLMIQNVYMYADSMLCNLLALFLFYRHTLSVDSFSHMYYDLVSSPLAWLIIFNNACIGIVTALFLRKLNSILKTFASALELMFMAVLSWIIFGYVINLTTIIAIVIVSFATYLYVQNPVVNLAKNEKPPSSPVTQKSESV